MPIRTLLLAAALLVVSCSRPAAPRPGVFAAVTSFAAAQGEARASGKLLVVDVMAEWCGPCKKMDAETWVHEQVVAFLGESAVAYQMNADHDPAAGQMGVEYLPTIIVYRDGQELGREVGYQSPSQLLGWLTGLRDG